MRINHQFEHFDPLEGELPDPYAAIFFGIVHRARDLLKGRTLEQIKQAVLVINRTQHDMNYIDTMNQECEQVLIKTKIDGQEFDVISSSNDVEALHKDIKYIMLSEYKEFPNAQWYELFAVIALSYAEMVCSELYAQANWPANHPFPKVTDGYIDSVTKEYHGLAMQAIAYAETLNDSAIGEEKKRMRSEKGITKRHAKTNVALLAFHDFYLLKKRKSMSNAAQLFCDEFPDKVAHLAHYNQVRTLREGLSSLLRNKRRSLQK